MHTGCIDHLNKNKGYGGTRICSLLLLTCYLILLHSFAATTSDSPSAPSIYPAVSSSASTRAPSKSSPSCYHHRLETCITGRHTDSSYRSIIVRIKIYCATVLFLHVIYSSSSSSPASSEPFPKGVLPSDVR